MSAVFAAVLAVALSSSSVTVKNRRLERDETVGKALTRTGLDDAANTQVQAALKAAGFDFKKARTGDQLRAVFEGEGLVSLDYRRSLLTEWAVSRDGAGLRAVKRDVARTERTDLVELTVESSVWDAALKAGEKPDVAITLADVFAWDVDFYRDVQKGDRMRAVVEKVLHKGRVIEYGRVLGAEYVGSSVGTKRSFHFVLPDSSSSYFLEDGSSARKTFLKSPLKFAQVTSGFGPRFHPIINQFGAHNGIDYGTPVGTPVWAVADGAVTRAGWDAGGGNMVCVKHVLSLETCYLHLSKIHVKAGQKVAQKTILGDSGNTGLSTGPHLHFGMKRGGHWVNPLSQNMPRADPLPAALLPSFREAIAPVLAQLDGAASNAAASP